MRIIHCSPCWPTDDERVRRARVSLLAMEELGWSIHRFKPEEHRKSESGLSFITDILVDAMKEADEHGDVIVFGPDDLILNPTLDYWIRQRVALGHRAFTGQRVEMAGAIPVSPFTSQHPGRCLIGSTKLWLLENMPQILDFIAGCEVYDLVMTAMICKSAGAPWSKDAMKSPLPVDLPLGCFFHETHKPTWFDNHSRAADNRHNINLAKQWFREHWPEATPDYLQ